MENEKDTEHQANEAGNNEQKIVNGRLYAFPVWYIQTRKSIYYILGIIEVLLAFRLFFKLLGANASNSFVALVYTLTRGLNAPFQGIFNIFSRRAAISVVFEPATIIAMIVYAILAFGLVNLVRLKIVDEI